MVGTIVSDPVFQIGIFGAVVGTIALLLASGWSSWNALSGPRGSAPASSRVPPVTSISPTALPTADPTAEPTPSPNFLYLYLSLFSAVLRKPGSQRPCCHMHRTLSNQRSRYAERYVFPTGCT